MKQKLLLRSLLLLFALIAGSSSAWADDELYYTLDGTTTGGSSGYATESDIAQNGINWKVTGNTTMNPWRIGGKNLTNEDRPAYSTTGMGAAITKVELELGSINLTCNSIKLIVASNSDFSTVLQTIEKTTITANSTLTFTPSGSSWAKDAYYKFVFNVTAGSSNQYVQLKSAKFYKKAGSSSITTTVVTFPEESYTVSFGDAFTAPTPTCNSDGAKTYSSSKTDVAEVNETTGAVTIKKPGNTTITLDVAATANYTAGQASYLLKVVGPIEDGVFNFAINQNYGSGVVTDAGIVTAASTWTAGKVTMAVAGRNQWANNQFRLYKTSGEDAAGNITLSVPSGYFMTRIDLAGGTNLGLTSGGGVKNGTIWSGKSQSVKFTHDDGNTINLTKITVTYCTEDEFNTKVNITMGSDGYMTYCPQDAALSFGTLEAYVVSAVGDDNVTLTPISKAPAGCAVVLKGAAGSYDLTKEETPDAVASNRLSVSYYGTITSNSSYDVYALAKKNDVVGFYKVKEDVYVPAGKCYISISKSTSAPDFLGFGDETTAITNTNRTNDTNISVVYDLSGRQVKQPMKGLYIMNGKKVIIK